MGIDPVPGRRGTRDNGLHAGNYRAVADLDPRIADALLASLRDRGIAAYAEPVGGAVGGSLERRLPARPVDRLFVDDQQVEQARGMVAAERVHADEERDFEASWQQVLVSLQTSPSLLTNPWPEREDLPPGEQPAVPAAAEDPADAEDEHFEPPPPPPLPRLRPVTWIAIATMVLAVVVIRTGFGGRDIEVVAFVAFLGAVASLVYNMRQGPPDDSGWDDGAVV